MERKIKQSLIDWKKSPSSPDVWCQTDWQNIPYSIRISVKNFGEENRILSIPLYAVFCIK